MIEIPRSVDAHLEPALHCSFEERRLRANDVLVDFEYEALTHYLHIRIVPTEENFLHALFERHDGCHPRGEVNKARMIFRSIQCINYSSNERRRKIFSQSPTHYLPNDEV